MAAKMGFALARHLLNRTDFGPSYEAIEAAAARPASEVVDAILSANASIKTPHIPPPQFTTQPTLEAQYRQAQRARDPIQTAPLPPRQRRHVEQTTRSGQGVPKAPATKRRRQLHAAELSRWWHRELFATPHPLRERMVVFWHNHFATSMQKVKRPLWMYRQNALFREHALGSFRELLGAMVRDPALLLYLDNTQNRRARPNENFARELLELFTLGEGSYTERDVKETARAFTGWGVDRAQGTFVTRARRHDNGEKVLLGTRGALDGQDVVNIVLKAPQTATHLVQKLWRAFVSPELDDAEVAKLAALWRASDYAMVPLLRAMLTSPSFLSPTAIGARIKSPIELVAGTVRLFNFDVDSPLALAGISRRMGQRLLYPPNVKGWPGGTAWITTDTLLYRQRALARVFRDPKRFPALHRAPWETMLGRHAKTPERARLVARTILPLAPIYPTQDDGASELILGLIHDPLYQLC